MVAHVAIRTPFDETATLSGGNTMVLTKRDGTPDDFEASPPIKEYGRSSGCLGDRSKDFIPCSSNGPERFSKRALGRPCGVSLVAKQKPTEN